MQNENNITPTEEEIKGMKMIQALQRLVGIEETDKDALDCWQKLSDKDREDTAKAHRLFCEKRG